MQLPEMENGETSDLSSWNVEKPSITATVQRMVTRSRAERPAPESETHDLALELKGMNIEPVQEQQKIPQKNNKGKPSISQLKKRNANTQMPKINNCGFCGKEFQKMQTMTRHMRTHTSEKPHQCETCDKSFSLKCNMERHKRVHTGEKPYQCKHCLKRFPFRSGLRAHRKCESASHLSSKITINEVFPCPTCGEKCTDADFLKLHIRSHLKPYTCEYCSKSFALKNTMIDHTRRHTGEKPFQCGFCSRTFAQNSTLRQHILTHTLERSHECTHCGKTFVLATTLTRHMATHGIGRKYHTCQFCHKQLTHISSLLKHIRNHLKERYTCQSCPKSFSTIGKLNIHTKIHTDPTRTDLRE